MDYIILFHDSSTLMISKAAVEAINRSKAEELRIGGSIYKRSSIAKILTVEDYFQQYPDKRPEERKEVQIEEVRPMTAEEYKRMNEGLLKGLKSFINEEEAKGNQVPNARQIYADALQKGLNKNAMLQSMSRSKSS